MREELKQFLKENWKTIATAIGAVILLVVSFIMDSCGSTWRISGNTVNVNNECQNDSITHHNDTINNEIREISQKRMD